MGVVVRLVASGATGALLFLQQGNLGNIPSWVDTPYCRVTGKDSTGATAVDPSRPFRCTDASGTVSCDARNALAFDLPTDEACRLSEWPWIKSREVEVNVDEGAYQAILLASGRPVVLGTRAIEGRIVKVPVAESAVVRIRRGGTSPVTLPIPSSDQKVLAVPPPLAGGEIFIGIVSQHFLPVAFNIRRGGRRIATVRRSGLWASYSGVEDGDYRIEPEYVGGVLGPPVTVAVRAGQTADVEHQDSETGAVNAVARPALCNQVSKVRILGRPAGRNGNGRVEIEVGGTDRLENCVARFEGLAQQQYVVEFSNDRTGVLAKVPVTGVSHVATDVEADAPSFKVMGRVTRQGEPLGGRAELVLFPEDEPANADLRAEIGAAGGFELSLPRGGTYTARVAVNGTVLVGTERQVSVEEGVTPLNWDLPEGEVEVNVEGWDRQTAAEVRVTWAEPGAKGLMGSVFAVNPDESLPLRIPGLTTGRFELVGRQQLKNGEVLVSRRTVVTLTPEMPRRKVALRLARFSAELEVIDENGARLQNVRATRGEGITLPSPEPGLFEITPEQGEPGASMMLSAPGLVPICIPAPSEGRSRVVLKSGTSTVVTYTDVPSGNTRPIGRLWWPGLACELPLSRFSFVPIVAGTDTPGRIAFQVTGVPIGREVALLMFDATPQAGGLWFRPETGISASVKVK